MTLIEMLRHFLDCEDPYEDMPDYGYLCEHLGLDPTEDRETVREAIEMAIADMEPDGEEGVSR